MNQIETYLHSEGLAATVARFSTVSFGMFLIDTTILYLCLHLGLHVFAARCISYFVSIIFGYFMNRRFTFGYAHRNCSLKRALSRQLAINLAALVVNFSVFGLVLEFGKWIGGTISSNALLPMVGVALGGLAAMAINYVYSKKHVFNG